MITLRDLVKSDRVLGSITSDECHLIASALDCIANAQRSWIFRLCVPKSLRERALEIRMLAATLDRTPEEPEKSFNTQIKLAMVKDKTRAK